jgi:hypothetical protein
MMTKQNRKTLITVIIVAVLVILAGYGGCCKILSIRRNMAAAEQARAVARAALEARYPKPGDKVEIDGKKVTIVKQYTLTLERRYQIRMENGTLTDVAGAELLDKKPIKDKP